MFVFLVLVWSVPPATGAPHARRSSRVACL